MRAVHSCKSWLLFCFLFLFYFYISFAATGNGAVVSESWFLRRTKIAADNILIFYFYLSKKIRLEFSYESSA